MTESTTLPCPEPASAPDAWAVEAARLPLAFAQVREDPRLDVAVAETLPAEAVVVMVASGGETLVQLARLPHLSRIHAVDMNAAQLSLARCKLALASRGDAEAVARLLGHEEMPAQERKTELGTLLQSLALAQDALGPPDFIAEHGPDHAGRYERCFAELRRVLASGVPLEAALERVMSQANLVALFGHEAAQNPRQPFHEHFAQRTHVARAREGAATNPFLRQMYEGTFAPGHRYDWLECDTPPQAPVKWHHGRMTDVLGQLPAASADLVHVSNILDWLSPAQARQTLAAAARVLKPGGRLVARQLNSSLDFDSLCEDIAWDHALGHELEQRDRSFFYPQIFVGTRA
ncbi:MAG: DUF3419 family protein [Prosthecobacter sp.]